MNGEKTVVFRTERLDVRLLTLRDLEPFHEVWSDPEVIFWGPSPDLAGTSGLLTRFLARRLPDVAESGWFAVIRRSDGAFVGDVVLEPASWNSRLAELGWHVAGAQQRWGYATEAASGLLRHARRQGLTQLWAKILPDNVASRRVASHLSMHAAGTIDHGGRAHDLFLVDLEDVGHD